LQPDAPESEPGLTRRARRALASASATDSASDSAAARTSEDSETRAARRRAAIQDAAAGPEASRVDVSDAADDRDAVDAFEAAAQLFSFTGENPIIVTTPPVASDADADTSARGSDHAPRRTRRSGSVVRRVAAAGFSVGVMAAVGLLTVAVTVPAEALAAATQAVSVTSVEARSLTVDDKKSDAAEDQIQAFVAPESADTELNRDEKYSTATFTEIAAATGITRHTNFFVNDPSAPIQWPFAVGVPISDGYGPRWGSFHYGLDFTPGEGAEIQAVAAGTVRIANESGGAFGVHVMIDHEINGEVFSTHYAHMLYGSLQVKPGDVVQAGTVLGHVGDTGLSYGAHLHFEVFVNGARIDPLPWLREHAGG
jgi:murein DD-endopeptidase MepM/ murein hydrolase activator NlpD